MTTFLVTLTLPHVYDIGSNEFSVAFDEGIQEGRKMDGFVVQKRNAPVYDTTVS